MKKSSHIVITRHDQDSDSKWDLINSFVAEWNNSRTIKFFNLGNVLWKIIYPDIENPEYGILNRKLRDLHEEKGVVYHGSVNKEYEKSDYETGDYIQIFGISLDGLSEPFVLNEEEAFSEETACPKCGYSDFFSKIQVKPLIVNETLLIHPLEGFVKPEQAEWDLINVTGGRLLVSKRFVSILEENKARGYVVRKVFQSDGVHSSERVFQIEVEKVILIPYFQVLNPEVNAFCSECGASIKATDEEFTVAKSWTENVDFFSRHPNRATMIYVSNRIFTILDRSDLYGLVPNEIIAANNDYRELLDPFALEER